MDNDQAGKAGAGERNRTLDLRITNALLYQLSYTGSAVMIKEGVPAPQMRGTRGAPSSLRLPLGTTQDLWVKETEYALRHREADE